MKTRLLGLGLRVNQGRDLGHELLAIVNGLSSLFLQRVLDTGRNGGILQHDGVCRSLKLSSETITLGSLGCDVLNKVFKYGLEVLSKRAVRVV